MTAAGLIEIAPESGFVFGSAVELNTHEEFSNMANSNNRFGPENPHPLSTLTTELVWEGKYDDNGNR